ncbi:phosphoglycerate kinase [Candidatus Giovannonibacteria bacterium]|nr:phosphoglycerate kinase [Candidatus Giovannonibacteria bacterium]
MDFRRFKGKRVLLRVDFNVPLKNGKIADDFRVRAHIPTIKSLLKARAQIFLISHLQKDDEVPHLDVLHKKLTKELGIKVKFLKGELASPSLSHKEKIILFDNIRLNEGEEKNDSGFAKKLSEWGDVFVNDAFSAAHRSHASIVGITKFLPSFMGPVMEKEVKNLSKSFRPAKPFLFVLAGKKFETKEPLIVKFLKKADTVFVGGALANTFLKQRGFYVGNSETENVKIPENILNNKKTLLPMDVYVLRGKDKFSSRLEYVKNGDLIYDAGPETLKKLAEKALSAKFILWNGTLGFCEGGFDFGTKEFAKALGNSRAYRIAGGGDTVAALFRLGLEKNFDFISTGGGAMLEFLAKGTLPGIEALRKRK